MEQSKAPETAPTQEAPQQAASAPNTQAAPATSTGSDQPTTAVATQTAPAPPAKAPRPLTPVVETGQPQYIMDSARFDQAQRVALTMAQSTITPKHLRFDSRTDRELTLPEKAANCFRIVNQALRWNMDPFAVMDKTYFVDGRLAYEGQLVASVIQTSGVLQGRLQHKHDGQGEAMRVTISGTLKGESDPRTVELTVKQGRTKNAMWDKNPAQKLIYSATLLWARRHCPEVILGVMTDDDLDTIQEQRSPGEVHVMTELETIRQEVYEKMPAYIGRDKPELEAQCRDAVRNKRDTVEFWHGILAQIEPPQK